MNKIMDSVPKLVAIASFLLLIVSVFHDWGYFWVVGSKFQEVQTPYDFIANSIEWLPGSLLVLAVVSMVLFAVVPKGSTPTPEGFGDVVRLRVRRKFRFAFWPLLAVLVVGFGFSQFVTYRQEAGVYIALTCLLWFMFPISYLTFMDVKNTPSNRMVFLLYFSTFPLLFLAFATGSIVADYDVFLSNNNIYSVQLKSGSTKTVKVLRTFEKGILDYSPSERLVTFVRWDEVKSMQRQLTSNHQRLPLSCLTWGQWSASDNKKLDKLIELEFAKNCIPPTLAKSTPPIAD